jgi:hypothetical protein
MSEAFTGEYADMRTASQATFRDKCKIGVRSASSTVDPSDVTFAYGSEIACGLSVTTRGEIAGDGSQATITNALLRLPWGTTINTSDRIQITEQGGTDVSVYYAVDGAPYQSLINTTVRLKRITGSSDL